MKCLVIGGTGTVGSQVIRELVARGASVRALVHHAEKAKGLPPGVEAVTGDMLDPATVRSVFRGADGVFLLNPVSETEAHQGLMGVLGARLSGVQRLVYMSVHDAHLAPELPHFGSKVAVEAAIAHAGIPHTILRPNNFYQNDEWFKDVLLQHGVYPQPIGGVGISRVDVRDIAEAAAIALTAGGHDGKTYNLVGPDVVTGESTAAAWGRALGKKVVYAGDDLEAWEKQAAQMLPPWMAFDFRMMYAFFQKHGLKAGAGDVETVTRVLGHPPRRFEDYARERAAAWKG